MALADSVPIIWLAVCDGQDGGYHMFDRKYPTTPELTTASSSNTISELISTLEKTITPILYAHTCDRAIELIKSYQNKKIIFISSASLGQRMIPLIMANNLSVDRFYIFGEKLTDCAEFGLDDRSCLQKFDQAIDLLVQLVYDISNDIIQQEKTYMQRNDAKNALKYFEYSLVLNMKVNEINNSTCLTYLKQLNGDSNEIGLIQQAKDMLSKQQQQSTEEKLSQEESQEYYDL